MHTPMPTRELQCQGPCGLHQVIENFSKNSRTSNKVRPSPHVSGPQVLTSHMLVVPEVHRMAGD